MTGPASDTEVEQRVLGALLLSERGLAAALDDHRLQSKDFARAPHAVIFEAITAMRHGRQPIDVLTLECHLREKGRLDAAGGLAVIDALTHSVPLKVRLLQDIRRLQELSDAREQ